VLTGDTRGHAFIALINRSVILNTQEKFADPPLSIYPNPVQDHLHISPSEKIKDLRVRNLMGELILSQNKAEDLDLRGLSPGVYFLEVSLTQGQNRTQKFVKE
jgi:hypothetical protein